MRGYYILAAISLFIVVTQGLPAQEVAVAKPKLHTACPCDCGSCGPHCRCTHPNECDELYWVAGGPDDPGYYLCTKTHVWGALYPDGRFRAYSKKGWDKGFSQPPIAPPECTDGQCPNCPTCPVSCGCEESDDGAAYGDAEACAACQGPSCGSCDSAPQFRTPIRTFFHRHRPLRRLVGRILFGCCY